MALTRKMLSAMDIDSAKIDEIIAAHTETVNALKEERDSFKASAEKLTATQKELEELKGKVADGNKDSYKVKYEALVEEKKNLQSEFDKYKADVSAKESHSAKVDAYKGLLKEAGISEKRIDSVLKVSDIDAIELDENGKVSGSDNILDSIKSEWSDFIVTNSEQGAKTPKPPQSTGGNTLTKESIMQIKDTEERQKAWGEFLESERRN